MKQVKLKFKVKDSINLSNLKSYGFTTNNHMEYYKFMSNDEYLWVDKISRELDMTSPDYFCEFKVVHKLIDKLKKNGVIENI